MVKIIAIKEVKEGKVLEWKEEVAELVLESRKESGNISYEIYQDSDNENLIIFVEEWTNKDYITNVHCNTPHVKNRVPTLKDFYKKEISENWTTILI